MRERNEKKKIRKMENKNTQPGDYNSHIDNLGYVKVNYIESQCLK